MQLTYISIQYYRSITSAYKLDLSNLTVLIGKNNVGKTNIIKAIKLGMDVLENMSVLHRRKFVPKTMYDWNEDFPIAFQGSKKIKKKSTVIRMDFTLSVNEMQEFQKEIHSSINGDLSIYIEIDKENAIRVTVPKRGKNASAMTTKIVEISRFLCDRFGIQYIPAIRSENDAYHAIVDLVDDELGSIDDPEYQKALEYIDSVQERCLKELSSKVKGPLNVFLPSIKSIDLYHAYVPKRYSSYRKTVEIDIDDGARTSLSNKGDGVKSLVTIAMLSQISANGQRLIIVDEPENHLHPEAIHFIDGVLHNISSTNQVLISTHNPIFVNRNNIASNLIVDDGCVEKASQIGDIRSTLGIYCSDNLLDAYYVIVVEGKSDKEVICKCLSEDVWLSECLRDNTLVVHEIGGVHNLTREAYLIQQMCCNYLFLLDYDSAGKDAANQLRNALSVPEDKIRFFMKPSKYDTELEDFYNLDMYKEFFLQKGIDLSVGELNNSSLKWSDRINRICAKQGIDFSKKMENDLKEALSHDLFKSLQSDLTDEGHDAIIHIIEKVKNDLENMKKL